ncbi:unnamed protein product [Larinioides sclopetarius]|uniref:DUF4806 domain-containing protein n=1 Tax=Larinioides sclopetarius TaxID=280406 RepID=A0AAV2C1V1_9ARAC
MGSRYLVVNFVKEGTVEVVPDKWERSGLCFWPPVAGTEKLKKMVLSSAEPCEDWLKLPVKVLYTAGSYERARRKLKKAEDTSNLSSESEANESRRKRRKRNEDSSRAVDADLIDYEYPLLPMPVSLHRQLPSTSSFTSHDPPLPTPPMNTQPSSSNEAFQRKVLRLLEEIKEDQAELRAMIQSSSKIATNSSIPEDFTLPLNSPEELHEFNEYLLNKENFSRFCTYFGSFGGQSYNSLVRRILTTVLTNQLSLRYNWRGTNGIKLAFQNFKNVIQMILDSVRNHRRFESVTQHEVEMAIKKWLVYAKDREGGRVHRAQPMNNT